MIDGNEKRNRQLAFEFQNSHFCEKRSKDSYGSGRSFNKIVIRRNSFSTNNNKKNVSSVIYIVGFCFFGQKT